MKKPWHKPELVVLVRKKSDKSILLDCKEDSISNTTTKINNCDVNSDESSDSGTS
jgi:hypothetical protein